jgi:hypothetical protein
MSADKKADRSGMAIFCGEALLSMRIVEISFAPVPQYGHIIKTGS